MGHGKADPLSRFDRKLADRGEAYAFKGDSRSQNHQIGARNGLPSFWLARRPGHEQYAERKGLT